MAMRPSHGPTHTGRTKGVATFALESFLRGYSQILFSRSMLVGAALLAATAVSPRLLLAGLGAVALATLVAVVLSLSPELNRSGLFGYNALLVGLGSAILLEPGWPTTLLLVVAVAVSVLMTAAVHSALGTHYNLPALTIPFLLVFFAVLGAAPVMGIGLRLHFPVDPVAVSVGLPRALNGYLQSLGAIFFLPRIDAGALVLLGLVIYSRVGFLLSVLGYALGAVVLGRVGGLGDPMMSLILGYNCVLVAIALGGVWFVPSPTSFVFAGTGVLAAALVTLGVQPWLAPLRFPTLIVPFNLTVILFLYAMRQRIQDGRPKAVDFMLGTPEQNLNYYRTRVARFGSRYAVRILAPFLGRWVCTQGVDGEVTHRGPWRHALDFEVEGPDGKRHRGSGKSASDYHCYKLPVTAVADGTVARVVDGVRDNPVGSVNLKQNWGNLVLVYHGLALYSMVAHLAPGSIKVREGEIVRAGDTLGLCGNSGRSPIPHLHFQLQATARVGAPTRRVELHDVVAEGNGDRPRLHGTVVPHEGDVVRNLEPQDDVAGLFEFRVGEPFTLGTAAGGDASEERIEADVDLFGRLLLRSLDRGAVLYYELTDHLFMAYDTVGSRRSCLHLVQMALGRVPFEVHEEMVWKDFLPIRHVLPPGAGVLFDLVSPFLPPTRLEVEYRARREGRQLVVTGRSTRTTKDGSPWLTTTAVLRDGLGLLRIEAVIRGRRRVAERIAEPEGKGEPTPLSDTRSVQA